MSDEMNLEPTVWTLYDTNKGVLVKMTTNKKSVELSDLTALRFAEAVQFKKESIKSQIEAETTLFHTAPERLRDRPPESWDSVVADKTHYISCQRYEEVFFQLLYEVAPQLFKEYVTQGEANV